MGNRLTIRQTCKIYKHFNNYTETKLSEIFQVKKEQIIDCIDRFGYLKENEEIPLNTIIPKLIRDYRPTDNVFKAICEEFFITQNEARTIYRNNLKTIQNAQNGYYTTLSNFIKWYEEREGVPRRKRHTLLKSTDVRDRYFINNVCSKPHPMTEHNVDRVRKAFGFTKKRFAELVQEMTLERR